MIESAAFAALWIAIGFVAGIWVGVEALRRTIRPVNVTVDSKLIHDYCAIHNPVLMPRGPEWEPKPGERLQ
jgi:hypothetical protein